MTQEHQSETDQYGNEFIRIPNGDVYDRVGGTRIVSFPDEDMVQLHILDAGRDDIDAAYTNINHDGLIAIRDFINSVLGEEE